MNEHPDNLTLSLYATDYAGLDDTERAEIAQHVLACAQCSDLVRTWSIRMRGPGAWRKAAGACGAFARSHGLVLTILFALFCAGATAVVQRTLLAERVERAAQARAEAEEAEAEYEAAWAELHFEEVILPTVEVLPVEPGGRPNTIRVSLSPRIAEGLVRDVDACWGDASDQWERVYEAGGMTQHFEATHTYALPSSDESRDYTLRIMFKVPDAVEKARRLTPEQLTVVCLVQATADGIRVTPQVSGIGPTAKVPPVAPPEIRWLSPAPGAEVGWRTRVVVHSEVATEQVTLLVRPQGGTTFYVQSGARPLEAGAEEVFEVGLGHTRSQQIGELFDILVVCSDNFRAERPDLKMDEVPQASVISRLTVRKAAGCVEVVPPDDASAGRIRIRGEIWTPNGGALLVRTADGYRVLQVISPSPTGGAFDTELRLEPNKPREIYLLVQREGVPQPEVDETLSRIDPDRYWLYGPAPLPSNNSAQSSNPGGVP